MENKKFDELIKNTFETEQNHIKGLNDIEVPSFGETMNKFWRIVEVKNNVVNLHVYTKKRNFINRVARIGAACLLITITSFCYSILFDNSTVNAYKQSIIKTLLVVKDRVLNLQSTSTNVDDKVIEVVTDGRDNITDLETLKKDVHFVLLTPTFFPEGFKFNTGKWKSFPDGSIVITQEFESTNGGIIKIIQQHHLGEVHSIQNAKVDKSTAKEIIINGWDVIIINTSPSFCIGTWYNDNSKFEVLGTVEEKDLISIIESIK